MGREITDRRTVVKPNKYLHCPAMEVGRVSIARERVGDNRRYRVFLDGTDIGYVEAHRVSTSLHTSTGVRYHIRHPLRWFSYGYGKSEQDYGVWSAPSDSRGAAIAWLVECVEIRP